MELPPKAVRRFVATGVGVARNGRKYIQTWSGLRGSNPSNWLGKPGHYHYAKPARKRDRSTFRLIAEGTRPGLKTRAPRPPSAQTGPHRSSAQLFYSAKR